MREKKSHVQFADERTDMDVTVGDVRALAKLFDVDTSPIRMQLSGQTFVSSVGQCMFSELAKAKLDEREKDYLTTLFSRIPTLSKYNEPYEFSKYMRVFNNWLYKIKNMENIMEYIVSQSDGIVLKPAKASPVVLGSVINKRNAEKYHDTDSGFESAYVGIEPIHKTTPINRKYISIYSLYLLNSLLPSYFSVDKSLVQAIKHKFKKKDGKETSEYRSLVEEFIKNVRHEDDRFGERVDDLLDRKLSYVDQMLKFFEISGVTIMLPMAIHRLNTLLQGFDLIDLHYDHMEDAMRKLTEKYGVLIPITYTSEDTELVYENAYDRNITENFCRGSLSIIFLNMINSSVRDVYNVYVTNDLRLIPIPDIMRSHACNNVLALYLLANLTRTTTYLHGRTNTYADYDVFVKAVEIIYTGIYPMEISGFNEYMSAKKRLLCLRIAQIYVELQFTSFLKYGLIMQANDWDKTIMFWHSFFGNMPLLLNRMLQEAKTNTSLQHVPLMLLLDTIRANDLEDDYLSENYNTVTTKPYLQLACTYTKLHDYIEAYRLIMSNHATDNLQLLIQALEDVYKERLVGTFHRIWASPTTFWFTDVTPPEEVLEGDDDFKMITRRNKAKELREKEADNDENKKLILEYLDKIIQDEMPGFDYPVIENENDYFDELPEPEEEDIYAATSTTDTPTVIRDHDDTGINAEDLPPEDPLETPVAQQDDANAADRGINPRNEGEDPENEDDGGDDVPMDQ